MAVKIGSARISENGSIYGAAGDQTGQEVATQDWYLHNKGWVVLRPLSKAQAETIAQTCADICENPYIGYDQGQRGTLYKAAKAVGWNCKKIKTPCETDCSAMVRVECAAAGIIVGDFNTANEAAVLVASGAFKKLTAKKYTESPDYLERGDILVTKTQGHTVTVLTSGIKSPARKSVNEVADEVIAGKWGNGAERRRLLEAAGYIYAEVQNCVNAKVKAAEEAAKKAEEAKKVYHVIKYGETLSSIAKKYGTTVQAIARLNGISNPNRIVAGHRIRVK